MSTPRDITFSIEGKEYRQTFLSCDLAFDLEHKLASIGFMPVAGVVARLMEKGGNLTLASVAADPELFEAILGSAHGLLQAAKPEDIRTIYRWLAEVTWVTTGDGKTEQRLDQANHFRDARDLYRYNAFVVRGCVEQLRPFWGALRTHLA